MSGATVAPARPFVTALRTERGKVLRIGEGGERVTLRVQFEPLWDAVAVDVPATMTIADLTTAVLRHFGVSHVPLSDYIVKLRGWEVKGSDATVGSSGAKSGSTLLVAYRFRRPVR
jgi:hypothetical protein